MKEQHNNKPQKIDIDEVFKSKNPELYKMIPKFILRYLKKTIHQKDLNDIIFSKPELDGPGFGRLCIERFGATTETFGLENIPLDKRYMFVSNHPLGGLDGIIFLVEVAKRFPKLKFPVNDILLFIGRYNDIFLPINKHGKHSREAAAAMEAAYASDVQMLFFPAGMVSRKIKGKITDLQWKPNFVKKAIKHNRDIVPVHIEGKNSAFFYNLARFRKRIGIKANIEMLYLVDEMFNQKGNKITLRFGDPIPIENIKKEGSAKMWAEKIKETVYSLPKLI